MNRYVFTLLVMMASLGASARSLDVTPDAAAASISLKEAQSMADASERLATDKGLKIVISIFDNHGNLKHFRRMDGSSAGSIQVSQLKASTAASFPLSTKDLAERSHSLPGNPYLGVPGFSLLGGGLPIFQDNQHLGGIGISGATSELDTELAQAGVTEFQSARGTAN